MHHSISRFVHQALRTLSRGGAVLGTVAMLAPLGARAQGTDPVTSAAKPPEEPDIAPFSNFYIAAGQLKFDVGGINARFNTANGFFSLSNDGFTIGAGFYAGMGKLLWGLEAHSLDMGYETTPGGRTDALSAYMVQARVGMKLVNAWDYNFHADLQMGAGIASLSFRDRTGGASLAPSTNPTWDDILLTPGKETNLKGTFYYIAPGLGFDYIFLKDASSQRGFTLGVQLVTSLAPHRTRWSYGGQDVFGSPDAAPVGSQVRITVGYGGFKTATNVRH